MFKICHFGCKMGGGGDEFCHQSKSLLHRAIKSSVQWQMELRARLSLTEASNLSLSSESNTVPRSSTCILIVYSEFGSYKRAARRVRIM